MSNRNKFFISNYEKILVLLLEIRLKLSIVYNLKTDWKIERKNKIPKKYL